MNFSSYRRFWLEQFASTIGDLRRQRCLSIEEAAKTVGMDAEVWQNIERARTRPVGRQLEMLADGLGMSYHELEPLIRCCLMACE